MLEQLNSIEDFIKIRQKCFFCEAPLKCHLTNYIGIRETGVPILNCPLKNGKFCFDISHTTFSYTISASGILDIETHIIKFVLDSQDDLDLNEKVVKQAFIELRPYIQLYCPKRNCPEKYNVASNTLRASKLENGWFIHPPAMNYESFQTGKLLVMNDYGYSNTNIYSSVNDEADPLVVPIMDFGAMGKDKVLMRVKTYATFS